MKEQIDQSEELARDIYDSAFVSEAVSLSLAIELAEKGYRKQSEVIDEFVKRLLNAFPEANRDNHCPAIYYDDYRYIIEELAEKMKGATDERAD